MCVICLQSSNFTVKAGRFEDWYYVQHICVHNMVAEWHHCLSTDKSAASLAVTLTEYKLCFAPQAPSPMIGTCEHAVWKSTQRSKVTANCDGRLLRVLIKWNPVEVEKSTVKAISEISLFKSDVQFTFIAVWITLIFIIDKKKKKKAKTLR